MINGDSVSSILNGESDVGSIYANEVFGVVTGSEIAKAVVLDTIDRQIARIEESPIDQALSEVDASMDIADFMLIAGFLKGEAPQTPYGYYGGHGFVWANAVDPQRLDPNHNIALTEADTPLNPVKQISLGIQFNRKRLTIPGKNILDPRFRVTVRSDDVYRENPQSRKRLYRPSVGIEIAVLPDQSIITTPTKYSGEVVYRHDSMEFGSNHPLAKELEQRVRTLSRGRK